MFKRLWIWMKAENTSGSALPWRMFWVGLIVRVLYMTLAHTYRFRVSEDHFQFGWEMGRIGRALATGRGFADPFDGQTGPTAWNPPLYPLFIGGVFRVFGLYTPLSAWVLLTLNSIFSAATAPAVFEIAKRCFSSLPHHRSDGQPTAASIALWSGWLWALYPAAMQYAVRWIWDMSLTAFILALLFVVALRVRGIGDAEPPAQVTGLWIVSGVLWGALALSNSSLLLLLPFMGIWMLGGQSWRQRLGRNLAGAALSAVFCASIIAPWAARNYRAFHAFIPFRDNFGAEFDESLKPEHMGFPWGNPLTLNSLNVQQPEFRRYVALGEKEYLRQRSEHARLVFARSHSFFLRMTGRRIFFFWVSVPHPAEQGLFVELTREWNYCFFSISGVLGLLLALRQRIPGAWLFAAAFLLLPVPYYIVTVQARFRHPIEPLIVILTVFLFQSATIHRNRPASDL